MKKGLFFLLVSTVLLTACGDGENLQGRSIFVPENQVSEAMCRQSCEDIEGSIALLTYYRDNTVQQIRALLKYRGQNPSEQQRIDQEVAQLEGEATAFDLQINELFILRNECLENCQNDERHILFDEAGIENPFDLGSSVVLENCFPEDLQPPENASDTERELLRLQQQDCEAAGFDIPEDFQEVHDEFLVRQANLGRLLPPGEDPFKDRLDPIEAEVARIQEERASANSVLDDLEVQEPNPLDITDSIITAQVERRERNQAFEDFVDGECSECTGLRAELAELVDLRNEFFTRYRNTKKLRDVATDASRMAELDAELDSLDRELDEVLKREIEVSDLLLECEDQCFRDEEAYVADPIEAFEEAAEEVTIMLRDRRLLWGAEIEVCEANGESEAVLFFEDEEGREEQSESAASGLEILSERESRVQEALDQLKADLSLFSSEEKRVECRLREVVEEVITSPKPAAPVVQPAPEPTPAPQPVVQPTPEPVTQPEPEPAAEAPSAGMGLFVPCTFTFNEKTGASFETCPGN